MAALAGLALESGALEGFAADSEASAAGGGVNPGAILAAGLGLASSVLSLVSSINKGNENLDDIKSKRLAAGLVARKEKRQELLDKGEIPAYYAESNIRRLLLDDTLPFGWSLNTLIGQGFADAVAFQQGRHRTRKLAREGAESFDRQRETQKSKNLLKQVITKRESDRFINALKGSVS
jgi:hypothetical protein